MAETIEATVVDVDLSLEAEEEDPCCWQEGKCSNAALWRLLASCGCEHQICGPHRPVVESFDALYCEHCGLGNAKVIEWKPIGS